MKHQANRLILLSILLLSFCLSCFSQSTGYINRPATNSTGALILNPNGDNYTSASSAGFLGNDVANSELPYRSIPSFSAEPFGDLRRGPNHLYSDFVPDANNVGYYTYFDGTNMMFRFRMGSIMPGSKGYSVLLDTDGKFGATGANADPDYQAATTGTNGNPGFEIEIVLETNSRIAIYNVAGSSSATLVKSYTSWQNMSQVSVAGTFDNGDPDFFIDFYIPYSDLTATPFLLTSTTALRMSATTVMSPQAAIGGPKSDIYGLSDVGYKTTNAQYEAYINAQPSFTATGLNTGGLGSMCTEAPVVNSPITTGTVTITGTWTMSVLSGAASTADITVYKNSTTVLGTILNVASGTTWTLSGVTLASTEIVTAKAKATTESMCLVSNAVVASACNTSTRPAKPNLTCVATGSDFNKGVTGNNLATGWTITVENLTRSTVETNTANPGQFTSSGTSPNIIWNYAGGCSGGPNMPSGSYKVYYTNASGCISEPYFFCVSGTGGSALSSTASVIPSITTPSNGVLSNGTKTIVGSGEPNSSVTLFVDGVSTQTITANGSGVFTFSNVSLANGQQVYITNVLSTGTISTSKCLQTSVNYNVLCYTTPPLINADNNNQITAGQAITGTSSEAAGTIIKVYTLSGTSVSTLVSTVMVQSGGTWTTGAYTAVASTTTSYYATAQNGSCGVSTASGTSFAALATTGRCGTITGTVSASDGSITGTLTGSAGSTTVNLYQDGSLIGSVVTASNTWTIMAVNLTYPLYSGGILIIGVRDGTNQEQSCTSSSTTVTCSSGPVAPNVNPPSSSVTPGQTQTYTIDNAIIGAFYGLSSSSTGESLGNGVWASSTSITLTTKTLPPGSYSVAVKGTALSGVSVCSSSPSMTTLLISSVLPLAMLEFAAQKLDAGVQLKWTTDKEINTSHFEIERSADGRNFEQIGEVKAFSTIGRNSYGFIDSHPLSANYYRLKMFDKNGRYSFSKVNIVLYEGVVIARVQPNPFHEWIHLYLKLEEDETIKVDIMDINGALVFTKSFKAIKGTNQILISELQPFKPGFYMISISSASRVLHQQKVIKQVN